MPMQQSGVICCNVEMLQEKLDFLLDKYSVAKKAVLKDRNTVTIDGAELPLMAYKSERRFLELRNMVHNGTLTGISVMRVARTVEKGSDIYAQLGRELDICQYVLGRKIRSVMAMENDIVLNAIATTEDGVVCTLEISATLQAGEPPKDKHEIIAQHGIGCDVVVDAQLKQDSIYVFGTQNVAYTDVDFELYGLCTEDVAVVRTAFALTKENTGRDALACKENIDTLVGLARKAVCTGERQVLA